MTTISEKPWNGGHRVQGLCPTALLKTGVHASDITSTRL